MLNFSGRFKEAREYFGMNKVEFAKYCKISPSTVTRYESGSMDIAIGAIEKLAQKLNIRLAWLLGIDDNMYDADIEYKRIPILTKIKKSPVMDFENFSGFEVVGSNNKADFCIKSGGCTTFFKKQATAENNELVAVLEGESILVRRYFLYGKQIVLKDELSGIEILPQEVTILGKAVLVISEVE